MKHVIYVYHIYHFYNHRYCVCVMFSMMIMMVYISIYIYIVRIHMYIYIYIHTSAMYHTIILSAMILLYLSGKIIIIQMTGYICIYIYIIILHIYHLIPYKSMVSYYTVSPFLPGFENVEVATRVFLPGDRSHRRHIQWSEATRPDGHLSTEGRTSKIWWILRYVCVLFKKKTSFKLCCNTVLSCILS